MNIRPFNKSIDEMKAIMAIDALTFKDCPYNPEEALKRLDFNTYPIWVAEEDNDIIGFIAFMKVQTLHYSGLWTDLIAVDPAHQSKGVGRALIEAGEALGNELGVDFKSALVRDDNTSSIKAFESQSYKWDLPFRLYIKD